MTIFLLFSDPSSTAMAVMSALTLLLTQLAGLWAMHCCSEIYLGSRDILASIPAILGTLWLIVVTVLIIVVRVVVGNNATFNALTLSRIIFWASPALSIWSVLGLIFIRVLATRGSRQHYGIIRRIMTNDWELLAFFIVLVTLYSVWMVFIGYFPFSNDVVERLAQIDLALSILLTRVSLLLFIGFYTRLSAMVPIQERMKMEEDIDELTMPMPMRNF
ncbi:hypothetical protein K450DRAFT_237006 [Umbelopsis ramanniana AG]|uniref:Uncharacterized protein n=1 Tax=Umbelopsis ramanniana AG TaxID=1314678 RepID=A0AAD5EDU6_UMBRA|nr:uncharacterized protein K450DRAFT_237006 [Umbelopsis ramanniana AG]KAI8580435.1 hypothetical protein K450DRAFT_237006 [Umbelopsis ramanniana AG]